MAAPLRRLSRLNRRAQYSGTERDSSNDCRACVCPERHKPEPWTGTHTAIGSSQLCIHTRNDTTESGSVDADLAYPSLSRGFSFSFAAPHDSATASANPFQPPARLPATTQMAPLSLASQMQPPRQPLGILNPANSMGSKPLTHEHVASANDNRIVPPPDGTPILRKASSSRSLKRKAVADGSSTTTKSDTGARSAAVLTRMLKRRRMNLRS